MPTDLPLNVRDPQQFTLAAFPGYNPSDVRRHIKKLLDKYKLGITPERITSERVGASGAVGKAIVAGTTIVRAFYDGTDNTGMIEHGKPVVFDTTTGLGVTGINPKWTKDEYKVVGKALMDYNVVNPEGGYIYVQLLEDLPLTGEIIARANPIPDGPTYPNIYHWSHADPGIDSQQTCVWPFELPLDLSFNPSTPDLNFGLGDQSWEGSGQYIWAFNLTRQYVNLGALVHLKPAGVAGTQYYCEYYMPPSFFGTLYGDLLFGQSSSILIDTSIQSGLEGTYLSVDDRMLKEGDKLVAGNKVWASLYCYNAGSADFVWRFGVTQSNTCPVKQTG